MIGPIIAGVTDEYLGFQWSTSVSYILTSKSRLSLLYTKPKGKYVWFAPQWSRICRYRYVYTCVAQSSFYCYYSSVFAHVEGHS